MFGDPREVAVRAAKRELADAFVHRWSAEPDQLHQTAGISVELGAHDPARVAYELGTGGACAAHDTVPVALWVAARHLDSCEDACGP